MSFKSILDFQPAIQFANQEAKMYYGYESKDVFVLPNAIGLALTETGIPDFAITIVKAQHPFSPVSLYGTLDIRLSLEHPLEMATKALRKTGNMAALIPAACSSGYLQLQPTDDPGKFPQELQQPVTADWKLVGPTRFLFRLSASTISLLKKSLLAGILLFNALAVLECKGLAVRLPLLVSFNPKELLLYLHGVSADVSDPLEISDIWNSFNRDITLLPLTIIGNRENELPGSFADAMTDRVIKRFGKLVPARLENDKLFYTLPDPNEITEGVISWNLSEPTEITRVLTFQLNPINAVQQLVNQPGGVQTSLKETWVPPLQTGFKYINVSANLPAYRPNIAAAGVRISATPNVPVRMQAISETVSFANPKDGNDIVLRFSPAEEGKYNYEPFMLVKGINGTRNIKGKPGQSIGEHLLLRTDDFAVNFLAFEAAPDLLAIASLFLSFSNNSTNTTNYEINSTHPLLSIGFPASETMPEKINVKAVSIKSGITLDLPPLSCVSVRLGLHHFPEYGYHEINITCNFSGLKDLITIELKDEGAGPDAKPSLCFFTPANSSKQWNYFADSPFACGYQYRIKKQDGNPGE